MEAGRHLRAGIELAVDEINDAGGIDGRPLELLLRDTAGAPEQAAAAVADFARRGCGRRRRRVSQRCRARRCWRRGQGAAPVRVLVGGARRAGRLADRHRGAGRTGAVVLLARLRRLPRLGRAPSRRCCRSARPLLVIRSTTAPDLARRARSDRHGDRSRDVAGDSTRRRGCRSGRRRRTPAPGWPTRSPRPRSSRPSERRLAWRACGSEIRPAAQSSPEWLALLGEDGADVPFLRYLPAQLGSLGHAGRRAADTSHRAQPVIRRPRGLRLGSGRG